MGLFSFLSGSKDGGAATADTPAERVSAEAPPSETSDPIEPAQLPSSDWSLNTGALTAPPPPKPDVPVVGPADPALTAAMQAPIIDVIKTVYDPEIPVDIYELGLIYDIIVDAEKRVLVKMTLTSPACPSAQQLPSEVRYKIKAIPEVSDAVVEIVWEPPWDKDRMSEAAKLQLGFF
jgi:FeS assembly SUF system protein